MKYLLIDFGASFVKTLCYDSDEDAKSDYRFVESPFLNNDTITKKDLMDLLESIVKSYDDIHRIIICTILGGHYSDDVYYSWKSPSIGKNYCLVSGLFRGSGFFHVHEHHKNSTNVEAYESGLKLLGRIGGVRVYSALSDTECVIEAMNLTDEQIGLNMGTGSQAIYKNNENTVIESYIPSGRSLLVFSKLFNELGFDMFSYMEKLTVDDIINSDLHIDLNVFEKARNYKNGGHIFQIKENNFNIKNMVSSVLRCYIEQYYEFIELAGKTQVILTGGIPKKIPAILDLIKLRFPSCSVSMLDNEYEATHLGMIAMVKKFLVPLELNNGQSRIII
jgi:hypothetical protein